MAYSAVSGPFNNHRAQPVLISIKAAKNG